MKAGPLSSDSLSSGDDITVAAKFAKRPGQVIVQPHSGTGNRHCTLWSSSINPSTTTGWVSSYLKRALYKYYWNCQCNLLSSRRDMRLWGHARRRRKRWYLFDGIGSRHLYSILTLVANPITFPRQTSITASQVRRSQDQRQTPQERGLCITTDLSKYLITITDESYNKSREERWKRLFKLALHVGCSLSTTIHSRKY